MLRPPVTPKKRTFQDAPEIVTPAWLEALTNRTTAATPQAPSRPNPGTGEMVDGGKYGTYDSNKWGGLYGLAVDAAKVGDFLVGNPAKSMWRTLKGENANTAFNPNSGASITQRLGAFGEDAMNVASVFPAMRTAGAARNPFARVRLPQNMTAPPLYEYGLHTTKNPSLTYVDPNVTKNMGAAKDALDGYAYQWRLSDPRTGAGYDTLADRATTDAMAWSDRLSNNMSIDSINTYLTRGRAEGVIDDANLAKELVDGRNKAAAVPGPLEIFGKVSYDADSYFPNRGAYEEAIKNMIANRKREIALNNKRLMYARGLLPEGYNLLPEK
jgi:hypothetical protein